MSNHRGILATLLIVNLLVLLGQVWPEGAPPFARWVNVAFLVCTGFLLVQLLRGKGDRRRS